MSWENVTIVAERGGDEDDDVSALSLGDQSYIMDLARQKQYRTERREEEAMENALEVYRKALARGEPKSVDLFKSILAGILLDLEEEYRERDRLQDEWLDAALEEELERRKEEDGGLDFSTHTKESITSALKDKSNIDRTIQHCPPSADLKRQRIIQMSTLGKKIRDEDFSILQKKLLKAEQMLEELTSRNGISSVEDKLEYKRLKKKVKRYRRKIDESQHDTAINFRITDESGDEFDFEVEDDGFASTENLDQKPRESEKEDMAWAEELVASLDISEGRKGQHVRKGLSVRKGSKKSISTVMATHGQRRLRRGYAINSDISGVDNTSSAEFDAPRDTVNRRTDKPRLSKGIVSPASKSPAKKKKRRSSKAIIQGDLTVQESTAGEAESIEPCALRRSSTTSLQKALAASGKMKRDSWKAMDAQPHEVSVVPISSKKSKARKSSKTLSPECVESVSKTPKLPKNEKFRMARPCMVPAADNKARNTLRTSTSSLQAALNSPGKNKARKSMKVAKFDHAEAHRRSSLVSAADNKVSNALCTSGTSLQKALMSSVTSRKSKGNGKSDKLQISRESHSHILNKPTQGDETRKTWKFRDNHFQQMKSDSTKILSPNPARVSTNVESGCSSFNLKDAEEKDHKGKHASRISRSAGKDIVKRYSRIFSNDGGRDLPTSVLKKPAQRYNTVTRTSGTLTLPILQFNTASSSKSNNVGKPSPTPTPSLELNSRQYSRCEEKHSPSKRSSEYEEKKEDATCPSQFTLQDFKLGRAGKVATKDWEHLLLQSEFEKHFGMTRDKFGRLPKWKRDIAKRKLRTW